MALVTRRHGPGLVIAEEAFDEARLSLALKQIDRRLVLQKHRRDGVEGGWVYKVIQVVSDDYAPVVFTWMDERGEPLPLSSGLVEELKRHLRGERTDLVSEDEHNRRLVERGRRVEEELTRAVVDDHRARVERGRVAVSLAHHNRRPAGMKRNRGRLTR